MKKIAALVVVSTFMLIGGEAYGQVYLSGAYGITDPSGDAIFPELEPDAGFRISIGNEISRKFAIEMSVVDLGEYVVGTLDGLPDQDELQDTLSIIGYDFSFVAKLPVRRRVSVFGRLGAFYWEGERLIVETVDVAGTPTLQETILEFDDVDYSLGVGIDYQFMRSFGTTLEANHYVTADFSHLFYGLGFYFTF